MVNILQVYVPFKLNFIQHILFMTITIKAIKKNFLSMFLFLSNTTGSSTGQPRQRCGRPPSNGSALVGDTMVQFHYNQTHLLVVH